MWIITSKQKGESVMNNKASAFWFKNMMSGRKWWWMFYDIYGGWKMMWLNWFWADFDLTWGFKMIGTAMGGHRVPWVQKWWMKHDSTWLIKHHCESLSKIEVVKNDGWQLPARFNWFKFISQYSGGLIRSNWFDHDKHIGILNMLDSIS